MTTPASTETTAAAERAQARFDRAYISSGEICRRVRVSRATVLQARRRGLLPDPVAIDNANVYVWEREAVEPYLAAWELLLGVRRNNAAAQQATTTPAARV